MLKKIITYVLVIALLVPMILLGGCSKKQEEVVQNGEVNENTSNETPKKDELIMAIGSEPDNGFDPTTGWGRYGSPLFQSTLLARDKNLNIVNDLATSYNVSEDGLTWTVEIRKDAKFSDGESLTAEDVVYTFETAANSGSVVDLGIMEKIEASDDYTVKFTLKEPQITFIGNLVATGIVPKHAHGEDYAEKPIGSGPFKLVQWDKGQQLIMETNPEYYGEQPSFKKFTILFLDQDSAFAAAKAGQIDVTAIPATFSDQKVPGMTLQSLRSIDNRGIAYPYVKSGGKTENGYPLGNDVTSDIAIRKAIDVTVDRQLLLDGVLNGYGSKASSVCDGMPWWNPETAVKNDGDLEAGKKILADAGWVDSDGDGIVEKDGIKAEFQLVYPASDKVRQSIAISVADSIKPLGINIVPEGRSWDEIEKEMHSSAVVLGWGGYDALEMYNLHSTGTRGNGWYNTGYYSNPTVDEYMKKALGSTTEEEANEYWKKAQWDGTTGFSALGDVAWTWLVNIDHLYLVREGLDIGEHKIQPHGHGWPITANIVEWEWK